MGNDVLLTIHSDVPSVFSKINNKSKTQNKKPSQSKILSLFFKLLNEKPI